MANTIQNWLDDASSVDADYAYLCGTLAPNALRRLRDILLAECDWTRGAAVTASPTIDANENLLNVTLPTKPVE